MSEVVPLPDDEEKRRGRETVRRRGEAEENAEALRKAEKAANDRLRVHRLRAVKAAIAAKPRIERVSDRRVIGRNMWAILDALERGEPSVSKATVLLAARQGRPEESTKRLPRFAIRPGLSEEDEKRRAEKLTQRIAPYQKIVKEAAGLAKRDEGDLLLELVQGTSYETAPEAIGDDDPDLEVAEQIVSGLQHCIDMMLQRYDLAGYFRRAERNRLVFLDGRPVAHEDGTLADVRLPFVLTSRLETALSRCPCVYLGSVRLGEAAQSTVVVTVPYIPGANDPEEQPEDFDGTLKIAGEAYATLDVSLGIGPFGRDPSPRAFLLVQAVTRIRCAQAVEDEEGEIALFIPGDCLGEEPGFVTGGAPGLDPDARDNLAPFDSVEFELTTDAPWSEPPGWRQVDLDLPSLDGGGKFKTAADGIVVVLSANSLRDFAAHPLFIRHGRQWSIAPYAPDSRQSRDWWSQPPEDVPTHAEPVQATEGTLLAALERAMRGDNGDEQRPDVRLRAAIEQCTDALAECEQQARKKLEDATRAGSADDATE